MIKANFSAYSKYVTDSLNQWDLNQVLQVSGLNLTSAPEVHFSNANIDRAIVRQSKMENHVVRVAIPNSLLQDPLRIYAHIGIYEGDTFKVVELVEIPVNPRKRPLDYQIDAGDEEVYSFKRLENLLGNKADSTVVNARIDNIVANANKTEGNSELVDVRYGADGTVYASAGSAVREQIAELRDLPVPTEVRIDYADVGGYGRGYIDTTGAVVDFSGAYVSDYIAVVGGTQIEYSVDCITNIACGIAVYDYAKKLIDYVGSKGDVGGQFLNVSGTYSVPVGAKYIRFSMADGKTSTSGAQYISFTTKVGAKEVIDNMAKNLTGSGEQWKGKKWVAFGTSITDTSYVNAESGEVSGKYVPYLAEKSGLVVENYGVAGGALATGGLHGATGNILTKIQTTDVSDADLITIEGFVNDYACAVDIGDIGDTEKTTFCGALWQAITYCLRNSHAQVVLITETLGREYTLASTGNTANYTTLRKNSIDLYQHDYNEAIKKMGAFLGCHVIDAGQKSQINEYHPEFLIDHIHHKIWLDDITCNDPNISLNPKNFML